jgi:hypothetical protein
LRFDEGIAGLVLAVDVDEARELLPDAQVPLEVEEFKPPKVNPERSFMPEDLEDDMEERDIEDREDIEAFLECER